MIVDDALEVGLGVAVEPDSGVPLGVGDVAGADGEDCPSATGLLESEATNTVAPAVAAALTAKAPATTAMAIPVARFEPDDGMFLDPLIHQR